MAGSGAGRRRPWSASPITTSFAAPERVVVALEVAALVDIHGQLLVDAHRGEMRVRPVGFEAEDAGEKARRGGLVMRRHNGVIENDAHRNPPPAITHKMGRNNALVT